MQTRSECMCVCVCFLGGGARAHVVLLCAGSLFVSAYFGSSRRHMGGVFASGNTWRRFFFVCFFFKSPFAQWMNTFPAEHMQLTCAHPPSLILHAGPLILGPPSLFAPSQKKRLLERPIIPTHCISGDRNTEMNRLNLSPSSSSSLLFLAVITNPRGHAALSSQSGEGKWALVQNARKVSYLSVIITYASSNMHKTRRGTYVRWCAVSLWV